MGRNQPRSFAKGVGAVAAPAVIAGGGHHGRPDGIQFYIALALEKVAVGINQAGPIAAFPQCAGAAMATVEVADVTSPERLHHQADALWAGGCSEKMDMVGHKHP